jgi:secondary thiamine-phosphate synthase enzyme
MIEQATALLRINTRGQGFYDFTVQVTDWARSAGAHEGLLTLHVKHTSCSLTIQENADPDVQRDLLTALDGFAPRDRRYRHSSEGPDDMPAHIRTMLTDTSLSIPVIEGAVQLGTWQGIYLVEHRDAPHQRVVAAHLGFER